jgi:hypothetical protein
MSKIAIIVVSLVALAGIFLAIQHARGKTPPVAAGLLHGLGGLVVIGLLVTQLLRDGLPSQGILAMNILIVAAIGGAFLGTAHIRGKKLARPFILVHGGLALIGAVILARSLLS